MEVLGLLSEQLEATSRFNLALRVAAMPAGSVEKVRLRNPTGIHPRARVVPHGTSFNGAVGIAATRTVLVSEKAFRDHPDRHPCPLAYVTPDYDTAMRYPMWLPLRGELVHESLPWLRFVIECHVTPLEEMERGTCWNPRGRKQYGLPSEHIVPTAVYIVSTGQHVALTPARYRGPGHPVRRAMSQPRMSELDEASRAVPRSPILHWELERLILYSRESRHRTGRALPSDLEINPEDM
jgi:hypothetical protein